MKEKTCRAPAAVAQLRAGCTHPYGELRTYSPYGGGEERVYRALREAIPILDAAIGKLVRLAGGFSVECGDQRGQTGLEAFLRTVPCGHGQRGIETFFTAYLDSLLTYGRAVGEMVVRGGKLRAVCWGDPGLLEFHESENGLDTEIWGPDSAGRMRPLPYQKLLLFTALYPEPGSPYGVSLLRGMPFLGEVLLKIYNTIGMNWERAGNVRYSVVYKPGAEPLDPLSAQQRGQQMAEQWARAMEDMKSGAVRDFVAVGDVDIHVIGSDGQILDAQTPVRLILEQLVAKTGLPPFLLGLNWSSTERMSAQQADLLTSELWALRRCMEPVLERICQMWLGLEGFGTQVRVQWDSISLQDITQEAQARLYEVQAEKLRQEMEGEKEENHGN